MPNRINPNASGLNSLRRNMQRIAKGAVSSTLTNKITAVAPLSGGGPVSTNLTLSMPQASSTANGWLSSTDWAAFNAKQPAGSYLPGSTAVQTTAPLQGGGNLSTGITISQTQAGSTGSGWLSSTDWNTFNGKQPAGNYQPAGSYLAGSTTVRTAAPLTGGGTLSTGLTVAIPQATTSTNGYLGSTDWNTFNSKPVHYDAKVADSGVISNTAAETAFTSSTLIKAGTLGPSTLIRLTGELLYQTLTNGSTLTLSWYLNFAGGGGASLKVATTDTQTMDGFGAGVNVPYPFTLILAIRSSGATAQLQVGGNAFIPAPAGNTFHFFGNGPLTFDSTVDNALQMTAKWATAATTSQIKCTVWDVEILPA